MKISILTLVTCLTQTISALEIGITNYGLLQGATGQVAAGMLDYYEGTKYGGTIGMFSYPYYWWHAGAAFGALVDYWHLIGDTSYVNLTKTALLYQTGDNWDYIPANQSTTEGNDDQAMWGLAVMGATERNFSNPTSDQPGWLYLSQAVFNTMAVRWDDSTCNGGLRWQIFRWNNGYDYKNAISNGALFHMAARLARYTGNDSYVDWADKVWYWLESVQYINESAPGYWAVYDGASALTNCTDVSKLQWTYNMGLIMAGSAYLYNYTLDEIWLTRTINLVNSSKVFFKNDTMYEAACQPAGTCDEDQRTFKAIFARCLGLTARLAPDTNGTIMPWIEASALAAAASCDGGLDGHTCGQNWFLGTYDNKYGLGEEMAALEIMQSLRIWDRPAPYTASTGGTSEGNPAAGLIDMTANETKPLDLHTKDKAGAGIITVVIAATIIGSAIWLII
ncbi:putative mannan endo-1,6-alpha-mannosidase [Saccharomycopsis crataegensis]|uniref:Mannan endo-1,6-alpha-mannosidase n=1 Tax=Saccharomycopsis crataegensis TaxID=43959 RepID=A0AAV5QGT6_9ASCO|nr:putative mannan endo-1,6-alpha-mannosidase [Saccharomycopsis crataegensis]